MAIWARSALTRDRKSFAAGRAAAEELTSGLAGESPKLLLVHLTVNHRQDRFLEGLRSVVGEAVPIVGCSGQGVMGRGAVYEDGYAASVLALGGDLECATARVDDIAEATAAKGEALARALRQSLPRPPQLSLIYYDPLAGADVARLLEPLDQLLEGPIAGAAAAHFFTTVMSTTYQYLGTEVSSGGAVGVSIAGDFEAQFAYSNGVAPIGIEMTVTRSSGCYILEFDGRPAMEVWREVTGSSGPDDAIANAALALGVADPAIDGGFAIRAPYVMGNDVEGLMLQTPIDAGTRVAFYHRTIAGVLDGTAAMTEELRRKIDGQELHAVLGFECGGRTGPFLGAEAANEENLQLQRRLGADVAYVGLVCWGEIFPAGGQTRIHNYAFPVVALTGARAARGYASSTSGDPG